MRRIPYLAATVAAVALILGLPPQPEPPVPQVTLDPIHAPTPEPPYSPTQRDLISLFTTGRPDRPVLTPSQDPARWRIARTIEATADWHDVPPRLVARLIWIESRGDSLARSPVGATGLMQVMPRYWRGVYPECGAGTARSLRSVRENICYGVKILRHYMDTHPESLREALLAYNGCVTRSRCAWYAPAVMRHTEQ